jgi:hypothetical protein
VMKGVSESSSIRLQSWVRGSRGGGVFEGRRVAGFKPLTSLKS